MKKKICHRKTLFPLLTIKLVDLHASVLIYDVIVVTEILVIL